MRIDSTHGFSAVLGQRQKKLCDVVDVFGRSRYDLLQIFRPVLNTSVVKLVLQLQGRKLGHVTSHWRRLSTFVNLSCEVDDRLSVVEDSLMRVV